MSFSNLIILFRQQTLILKSAMWAVPIMDVKNIVNFAKIPKIVDLSISKTPCSFRSHSIPQLAQVTTVVLHTHIRIL